MVEAAVGALFRRCPHARGGEPAERTRRVIDCLVVPTPVGVNLVRLAVDDVVKAVVPTPVGVNRRYHQWRRRSRMVVPTPVGVNLAVARPAVDADALSPRPWG